MKYHPGPIEVLTAVGASPPGTVHGRQFDWGGLLLKGNGGARRYAWRGRKSRCTCKGISVLDCKAHKPSRCESRS